MYKDFKLLVFCRTTLDFDFGGVGQMASVLLALISGLFSGRLVADLLAREKAMLSESVELGVFFNREGVSMLFFRELIVETRGRTFFGVITVRGANRALVGVLRALML